MSTDSVVRLSLGVPALGLAVGIEVNRELNPELAEAVLAQLPLTSPMGHVVISGEGIWMPSRLVYLGAPRMIQRARGSVYLNAPGQSVCITYGTITESAVVNQFGRVPDADHAELRRLGEAVWKMTVEAPVRRPVIATLALAS
jgi:hypothetical protein